MLGHLRDFGFLLMYVTGLRSRMCAFPCKAREQSLPPSGQAYSKGPSTNKLNVYTTPVPQVFVKSQVPNHWARELLGIVNTGRSWNVCPFQRAAQPCTRDGLRVNTELISVLGTGGGGALGYKSFRSEF